MSRGRSKITGGIVVDLTHSQEDIAFREEVRQFLKESLPPKLKRAGLRITSIFSDFDVAMARQKILYEKGWLAPEWPEEWGGTRWSLAQHTIFQEECKLAGARR